MNLINTCSNISLHSEEILFNWQQEIISQLCELVAPDQLQYGYLFYCWSSSNHINPPPLSQTHPPGHRSTGPDPPRQVGVGD